MRDVSRAESLVEFRGALGAGIGRRFALGDQLRRPPFDPSLLEFLFRVRGDPGTFLRRVALALLGKPRKKRDVRAARKQNEHEGGEGDKGKAFHKAIPTRLRPGRSNRE